MTRYEQPIPLDEQRFYKGLICGLRLVSREELSVDDKYHEAFGKALAFAREHAPEGYRVTDGCYNRRFDVYGGAEDLLTVGAAYGLMDLNRTVASLTLTPRVADHLLRNEPHAEFFKMIGKYFDEQLA